MVPSSDAALWKPFCPALDALGPSVSPVFELPVSRGNVLLPKKRRVELCLDRTFIRCHKLGE